MQHITHTFLLLCCLIVDFATTLHSEIELDEFPLRQLYIPANMSAARIPSYFISHGAPNLILQTRDPTHKFLKQLGKEIRRNYGTQVKGILMVSAHWETKDFKVTSSPQAEIIYDFGGFEREMYTQQYPAPSSLPLAERVCELVQKNSQFKCVKDDKRGWDHGCWMPLKLLFPEAEIPVVQLSLRSTLDPREHIELGKALHSLPEEGYLVIGSGGATHNLGALFGGGGSSVPKWATDFEGFLTDTLTKHAGEARNELLVDFPSVPSARQAHPRTEHLIPALVIAGLNSHSSTPATRIHDQWFASLSLASYQF